MIREFLCFFVHSRVLTFSSYFSAVAGDAPAFEVWPGKEWKLVRDPHT